MVTYLVRNTLFGTDVGTFTAPTANDLWDQVARHAGCADWYDMAKSFGIKDGAELGLVAEVM